MYVCLSFIQICTVRSICSKFGIHTILNQGKVIDHIPFQNSIRIIKYSQKVSAILYNSSMARQIETEFASNNRGKPAENTLN